MLASSLLLLLLASALATAAPKPARPVDFRRQTTFELSPSNRRLLGGKFAEITSAHLPSWFDFELFKSAYGKRYASPSEELERNHAYVAECARVLEARVMYRILASTADSSITRTADQVSGRRRLAKLASATC